MTREVTTRMKRGSLSPYDACLSIPISHLPLYAHLPLGMHANTCLSIPTSHCACKHNASTQAQCKHTSRDNQAPTMPLPMHRDKNTSGSNEARQCASTQAHAHATRPIASLPLSLPLSITCRRQASVALSQREREAGAAQADNDPCPAFSTASASAQPS